MQNVVVDVEELETYILSSTDADGIIDFLAWTACDHDHVNSTPTNTARTG